MIGFFIFLQIVCTIFLVITILMQSGRGGGLAESFVAAESMFGARTNEVMVRATMILTVFFLLNSVVLAKLSARKEKSLISGTMAQERVKPNIPKVPSMPPAAGSEKTVTATVPVTTNQVK